MDQKISMCPKVDQKMGSRAALEKIKVCRNAIPFRRSFYNISKKKKCCSCRFFIKGSHQVWEDELGLTIPLTGEPYGRNCYFSDGLKTDLIELSLKAF